MWQDMSPSLRGRGLKFLRSVGIFISRGVALFTRAWIEINTVLYPIRMPWSPSLRGRGLKYPAEEYTGDIRRSPSLRGRGLKFSKLGLYIIVSSVALFTRAWIEIFCGSIST